MKNEPMDPLKFRCTGLTVSCRRGAFNFAEAILSHFEWQKERIAACPIPDTFLRKGTLAAYTSIGKQLVISELRMAFSLHL